MTGRLTAALLGLWILAGAGIEAIAWVDRAEARHARRLAVAEANLAQAHRFIGACLRGEPAPLGTELLYDCRTKQMRLTPRQVRDELQELDRQWRAATDNRTS